MRFIITFLFLSRFIRFILSTPILLSKYDTPGSAVDLVVKDDYVYVADFNKGLLILENVQNELIKRGQLDIPGFVLSIQVLSENNIAFCITDSGLSIVNVSDKSNPSFIDMDFPIGSTNPNKITISEKYAAVTDSEGYIRIFNLQNETRPSLEGLNDIDGDNNYGSYESVFLGEKYIAICVSKTSSTTLSYQGDIYIYDLSDPKNPYCIDNYHSYSGGCEYLTATENQRYLYVLGAFGLITIDVFYKNDIKEIKTQDSIKRDDYFGLTIVGNYLYITGSTLTILSVENNENTIVGRLSGEGICKDVKVSNDIAYLACNDNGVLVVDVSDPFSDDISNDSERKWKFFGITWFFVILLGVF